MDQFSKVEAICGMQAADALRQMEEQMRQMREQIVSLQEQVDLLSGPAGGQQSTEVNESVKQSTAKKGK